MTNRPIKFRAYGKDYKTDQVIMTAPFELAEYVQVNESGQSQMYPLVGDDVVFMQFTGLTDKNGTEIYEGDIQENGVVVYEPTLGYGYRDKDNQWQGKLGVYYNKLEVIGNIYENPELLHDNG